MDRHCFIEATPMCGGREEGKKEGVWAPFRSFVVFEGEKQRRIFFMSAAGVCLALPLVIVQHGIAGEPCCPMHGSPV